MLPAWFAAALAVGAMLAVTGAMADDALADAADGVVGGATPERRLEIMKDSRHGTYGVAALCLYIVLRVVALGSIAAIQPLPLAGGIWIATTMLARSGSLWLSLELPSARARRCFGFGGRVGRGSFGIGLLFAAIIAFIAAAPFTSVVAMVLAFLAAGLIAWGWTALCRQAGRRPDRRPDRRPAGADRGRRADGAAGLRLSFPKVHRPGGRRRLELPHCSPHYLELRTGSSPTACCSSASPLS